MNVDTEEFRQPGTSFLGVDSGSLSTNLPDELHGREQDAPAHDRDALEATRQPDKTIFNVQLGGPPDSRLTSHDNFWMYDQGHLS